MKNAPLRHAAEYFFFRRFASSILRRPHTEVREFGYRLGRLGHTLLPSKRRLALKNFARVFPEMPEEKRRQAVRQCFEHAGSHFCEVLSLGRFDRDEILEHFEVEGWEVLQELEEAGEGFFLHTGHFGHWEMAIYPFALRLASLHAVGRPPDNPRVAADLMQLRERFGVTMIPKNGAAMRMRSVCRQKGNIALVTDQHVRRSAGIRLPFLGHPAWTSPVLALLALRHGYPIVPFACLPIEKGRYRLQIRPALRGEGRGDEAVAALTARILAQVEVDIRRHPELWLWMHRRWRDA